MITTLKVWMLAARPKTLFAAVCPVLVGTSIAFYDGSMDVVLASLVLLSACLIQIGTNFVNDYFDFKKGADGKERHGPTRTVSSGLINTVQMRKAITLCFLITFLIGCYIVSKTNLIVLVLGISSILAGYAYTGGPYPLGYKGLGDIFVFIFFGLVATVGSYYVQTLRVSTTAILSSIAVGTLLVNILVVNNLRDIETDKLVGKKTLAVIIGSKATKIQYTVLIGIAYLSMAPMFFISFEQKIIAFLPLFTAPLSGVLLKQVFTFEKKHLNKTLALTSLHAFIYSTLLSLAITLR